MDTGRPNAETMNKIAGLFGPADQSTEPPPEEETPAETPPEEAAPPAEGVEAEPQEPETPAKPKEVEVEINGKTYLVPEEISHAFIQQADYTRKSQDNAEMRRALTAQSQAIATERAFEQEVVSERRQLALLEAQLEAYKRVDWSAMETGQLMQTRAQLDQLKDAKAELENSIKTKRGAFDGKLKEWLAQSLDAGSKYIAQHIKTYDEKSKRDIMVYGLNQGYTNDELSAIHDPRVVVTLWKAAQWDALQTAKPGINKRAASAAPVVRPGAAIRNQQGTKDAQYRKDLASAKTSKDTAKVVQKRLEDKLFGAR